MDTREKIIEAGKELFATKGYAAVRTREIARVAGVNETTLFRHFGGKRELYESIIVMNIGAIDSKEMFHQHLSGDLHEDLVSVAKQMFMIYKSNAKIIKMIMKGIIEDGDSLEEYSSECRGGHIRGHILAYLQSMAANGTLEDDPQLIAEMFMSCMNGYLFSAFILEDREADQVQLLRITEKLISTINYTKE